MTPVDTSPAAVARATQLLDIRQERLVILGGEKMATYCPLDADLDSQAAALLRALSEERDALREALKPFAAFHAESVKPFSQAPNIKRHPNPPEQIAWGYNDAHFTWGDVATAFHLTHGETR